MWKTLMEKVRQGQEEKGALRRQSGYWTRCPSCGASVVKKALAQRGCYVCGGGADGGALAYKVACPGCGRPVVRESLECTGCYLCGYVLSVTDKGGEDGH